MVSWTGATARLAGQTWMLRFPEPITACHSIRRFTLRLHSAWRKAIELAGKQVNLVSTLNQVYSSLSTRRRYEVWFIRLGLADCSGAWWFRYLLMNPGREGCPD